MLMPCDACINLVKGDSASPEYNYAIIYLPNDGEKIEGKCQSWNDYEESDMLQVKIDGVVYLTHSSNVILEAR